MPWYFGPFNNQHILSRFQQPYQAAGEPKGIALFQMTETATGQPFGLCFSVATAQALPNWLEEACWQKGDDRPTSANWIAGDQRLNNQVTRPDSDLA